MTVTDNSFRDVNHGESVSPEIVCVVDTLAKGDMAVLRKTTAALARMSQDPESVDVNLLSEIVLVDPLMTLKVLATTAPLARARNMTRPETVMAAILWMGVNPFFDHFHGVEAIEDRLAGNGSALDAIRAVIARSRRAGNLALGLATQRNDTDASVVYETALVHDFAEIMLWMHEPEAAEKIRQARTGTMRVPTLEAQQLVLGYTLPSLTRALLARWQMPRLMQRLADPAFEEDRQVRSVQLGIRLARHLESGWSHPAIVSDLEEIAGLLSLSVATARSVVENIEA